MALIREHFRETHALIQMKKHLAWYSEGLPHATDCRARLFQSRTPEEAWAVFEEHWERAAPELPGLAAASKG
jgi:tRNA-dihydrouridine synthase